MTKKEVHLSVYGFTAALVVAFICAVVAVLNMFN